MFYSYDILTSRKHGVATVWLLATLGPKSCLRKINRKAIFDVDIPKACQSVTEPEAPMALRLSSNLLYGISRVYSQKCAYVLVDAQNAQSSIRAFLKAVGKAGLDPNAGKAKPDQLVLQDDPAFMPGDICPSFDLDFDLDFSALQSSNFPQLNSLLSDSAPTGSTGKGGSGIDARAIEPGSISTDFGASGGLAFSESVPDSRRPQQPSGPVMEDEMALFSDLGLNFDQDGNLFDLNAPAAPMGQQAARARPEILSDEAAAAKVRKEREAAAAAARRDGRIQADDQMDLGFQPALGDDGPIQLQGQAAHPTDKNQQRPGEQQPTSEELSSEWVEAAHARKRVPRLQKLIPADEDIQIHSAELSRWNNQYTTLMDQSTHAKTVHKLSYQAKKNAAFWVFGSGIGGIGADPFASAVARPLQNFAGQNLQSTVTGVHGHRAGARAKRNRSPESARSTDSETRRQRMRLGEDGIQKSRAEDFPAFTMDDDTFLPSAQFDDAIELARAATQQLPDDQSSQMPWNVSSRAPSLAGSRQPASALSVLRGYTTARPSSISLPGAGGIATGGVPPSSSMASRATARLASATAAAAASPLRGRGRGSREGSIHLCLDEESLGIVDENDPIAAMLMAEGAGDDSEALRDFQLFGANVDASLRVNAGTQATTAGTATQGLLDRESGNFLEFVKSKIADKAVAAEDAEGRVSEADLEVGFEELLPPVDFPRAVAAQAFQHVLALATKDMLRVHQEDPHWGTISMRVVELQQ